MGQSRSLKVRCSTWDQVEAFYTKKLRGGRELNIRLPFSCKPGASVTLALGLPNEMVMAIDGRVKAVAAAPDGKKSNVHLELVGFTEQVLERLKTLVADARIGHSIGTPASSRHRRAKTDLVPPAPTDAPVDELIKQPRAPTAEEVDVDERDVFFALEAEHRRLREAAAHEILGVPWDAQVDLIRRAYFKLTKRHHPDRYARHRSQAITHLASEVFIHVNKAYDRMREAAQAAGDAIIAGPALIPHEGWLAGFEDVAPGDSPSQTTAAVRATTAPPTRAPSADLPQVSFARSPSAPPVPSPDDASPERQLSHDSLFADVDMGTDSRMPKRSESQISQLFASGSADQKKHAAASELADEARQFLDAGKPALARDKLVEALQLDPRFREARALYHVANGTCLEADGRAAEAMTQYETALVHDRNCAEAQKAIEANNRSPDGGKRKGFFGRLRRR